MQAPKPYIREFEGLRGILAAWVTLGHALVALPVGRSDALGSLMNLQAVTVFIILSGFVIFTLLGNRRDEGYLPYLCVRFFRIFPVYFIVLAVSAALLPFDRYVLVHAMQGTSTVVRVMLIDATLQHPAVHFLAHALMLQGVIPEAWLPNTAFTYVGQAWSISVEWQFYLIAPFLFAWLRGFRNWRCVAGLVGVTAFCVVYRHYCGNGFFGMYMFLFALGFAGYFFYQSDFARLSAGQLRLVLGVMFCLGWVLNRHDLLGLVVWFGVFYAVVSARRSAGENMVTRLLLARPIAYAGRISYSLYMVHMQMMLALLWVFHALRVPMAVAYVAFPLACLGCALGVAAAMHHLVEAPGHEFGRRLAKRFRRPVAFPAEGVAERA